MSPKVSVVVPIYNAEKYLVQCIESVIDTQTLKEIEILLIDDGSTDQSLKSVMNIVKRIVEFKYFQIKI